MSDRQKEIVEELGRMREVKRDAVARIRALTEELESLAEPRPVGSVTSQAVEVAGFPAQTQFAPRPIEELLAEPKRETWFGRLRRRR